MEKSNIVHALATRLIDKLTVDGPDFEKIYEANGDLASLYPQDYSGIELTPAAVVSEPSAPVAAPVEETSYEAAPAQPDHTVEKPHATSLDPDDSNDPGPTD